MTTDNQKEKTLAIPLQQLLQADWLDPAQKNKLREALQVKPPEWMEFDIHLSMRIPVSLSTYNPFEPHQTTSTRLKVMSECWGR